MQEGSLNITTENGRVSVKDTYTSKSGADKFAHKSVRNSGNFAKTNPKERTVSREVKRELCSSGNPLRNIRIKDDRKLSKHSLEVKLNHPAPANEHFPLLKGGGPINRQESYGVEGRESGSPQFAFTQKQRMQSANMRTNMRTVGRQQAQADFPEKQSAFDLKNNPL